MICAGDKTGRLEGSFLWVAGVRGGPVEKKEQHRSVGTRPAGCSRGSPRERVSRGNANGAPRSAPSSPILTAVWCSHLTDKQTVAQRSSEHLSYRPRVTHGGGRIQTKFYLLHGPSPGPAKISLKPGPQKNRPGLSAASSGALAPWLWLPVERMLPRVAGEFFGAISAFYRLSVSRDKML